MESLLRKLLRGVLAQGELRQLIREHQRHFRRRVRRLPRLYFPGSEKSPDAIESLSHEAYTWFDRVSAYSGQTAFAYVVDRGYPPPLFLYHWRASATMRFLKEQGSEQLRERFRILRNVLIHLREGFAVVGDLRGERLWGLPEWAAAAPARPDDLRLSALDVDLAGTRGKVAVRRVLEAAGCPLTRSEVAAILLEHLGVDGFDEVGYETPPPVAGGDGATPETQLAAQRLAARVEAFYAALTPADRALLIARGYGEEGQKTRSWRKVAKLLGEKSAETYRTMEADLLDRLRDHFDDPEELVRAAGILSDLIRSDTP
jgi:hypothetical protein